MREDIVGTFRFLVVKNMIKYNELLEDIDNLYFEEDGETEIKRDKIYKEIVDIGKDIELFKSELEEDIQVLYDDIDFLDNKALVIIGDNDLTKRITLSLQELELKFLEEIRGN